MNAKKLLHNYLISNQSNTAQIAVDIISQISTYHEIEKTWSLNDNIGEVILAHTDAPYNFNKLKIVLEGWLLMHKLRLTNLETAPMDAQTRFIVHFKKHKIMK